MITVELKIDLYIYLKENSTEATKFNGKSQVQ